MEFVWVVRRRDLFGAQSPQGFHARGSTSFDPVWPETCRERGFFVERREAEACDEWKQVIPYCVLDTPRGLVTLERLPKGSEARLHGMLSVGVGGHINPSDAPRATEDASRAGGEGDLIRRGATRELHEELAVDGSFDFDLLGLVNDDSNAVGSVHVGLVLHARLDSVPTVRETDRLRATATPLVDLRSMCDAPRRFESWSEMFLRSTDWEVRS